MTVSSTVVRPGEAASVNVKWSIERPGSGTSAAVLSNDPLRPLLYLTLRGEVPQGVVVKPDALLLLGRTDAGATGEVVVVGPPEMAITKVWSERGVTTATAGSPYPYGEGARASTVEVTVSRGAPPGVREDVVLIETTHPDRPLVRIPVKAWVRSVVSVTPPRVFFGFARPGEALSRTIAVSSREHAGFRIISTVSPDPGIRATSRPATDGWSVTIAVHAAVAGAVRGYVTMETDLPWERYVRIPVSAHYRARR